MTAIDLTGASPAAALKRAVRMDTRKAFPSVEEFVASCARLGVIPSRGEVEAMPHATLRREFAKALGYD